MKLLMDVERISIKLYVREVTRIDCIINESGNTYQLS